MLAMEVDDDAGEPDSPWCSQVFRRNAARSMLAPTEVADGGRHRLTDRLRA
jgi:hypothetical protein